MKVATDLAPLVRWHRPLAHPTVQDETPFAAAIREAELLGVIARGTLPLGAALLADDAKGLTTVCRRLLPEVTETARFGGDLTAVVAGMPSVRVAELLDSTADREISGTASVWRFSADSVRLALYASRTARPLAQADRHRRWAPAVSHRRQRSKANEGDILASSRSTWPGCVTR